MAVRKTLRTRSWPRGNFYGATPFDGRRGVELVIGTTWGAHTPWFTVLTYRGGRLVIERSPYDDTREWAVDAYANGYAGWFRRLPHQGLARDRSASLAALTAIRRGRRGSCHTNNL